MNKTLSIKYAAVSAAIALMLASAPVAFADDGNHGDKGLGLGLGIGAHIGAFLKGDLKGDFKDHKVSNDQPKKDDTNKATIAGKVTAKSGNTLTVAGNNGTTYTVDATNATVKGETYADIAVNDSVIVWGTQNGSTLTATTVFDTSSLRAKFEEKMSHVTGGIVTAVNGSVFTIDSVLNPTTTVVTDSNTVIKAKGGATTTAALQVGQRVVVVGTTTATSTSGNTFTASIVKILGDGLKHLRFWMWF
ncbi:MAG TPA: DUF5666 domain-containing protein [Candidatus Paceibacterota bacterium]|nr:DUF5666 domain-containing protein [Candidatus Paceibacterota bacterium]